jgi:hypothetical protein
VIIRRYVEQLKAMLNKSRLTKDEILRCFENQCKMTLGLQVSFALHKYSLLGSLLTPGFVSLQQI